MDCYLEITLGKVADQDSTVVDNREPADVLLVHELETINGAVIVVESVDLLDHASDFAHRLVLDGAEEGQLLAKELNHLRQSQHALQVPL